MPQQMRSQRRLLTLEAGERRIADDQAGCCRSCDHGRHGRAAPQECDLADREPGRTTFALAATFQIDVDATIGDHVHVPVVLPFLTEHVTGLEAYLSADRLQQFCLIVAVGSDSFKSGTYG